MSMRARFGRKNCRKKLWLNSTKIVIIANENEQREVRKR